MVSTIIEVARSNVPLTLTFLVVFLVIFFSLGVLTGNVTSMKILVRLGIPVVSGKILKDYRVSRSINKDTLGYLQIPDTCYSPVMLCKEGFYKTHNSFKKESKRGELYLSDGRNSFDLQSIANKSDNVFKDLSVIVGTAASRNNSIRERKFTFLNKYVNSDLNKRQPSISLVDNGKLRVFQLLFAVEMGLDNRKAIKFTDRVSFLETMRKISYMDTGKLADNDVVILSGSTGIDTVLVFLVEKEV